MRRFLATVLALAAVVAACGDDSGSPAPAAPTTDQPDQTDLTNQPAGSAGAEDRADELLAEAMPEGASGTVVAASDGDIVFCTGFGLADRESEIAAGCDTVYDVMSISKQFTAAAILHLEMQGEIDVDDPIAEILDSVPEDKSEITVHHLLTHTAGMVEALGDDYEELDRDELLAEALGSDLVSPPGEEHHYSNTGYSVLAAIVEIVTGQSYDEFLVENLFEPAGMTQTGYLLPGWDDDQVAVEYDEDGSAQGRPYEHPWDQDGPYWNLRGNGGVLSTAEDMFRWHVALEGDEILSEAAKAKLFEAYVDEGYGDTFYGYGWVVEETDLGTAVWHDGGNGWSSAEYWRFVDEGLMLFWVTNQQAQAGAWDLGDLEDVIWEELLPLALAEVAG